MTLHPAIGSVTAEHQQDGAGVECYYTPSESVPYTSLHVGFDQVKPTSSIRDLGINIDVDLTGPGRAQVLKQERRVLLLYVSCGLFAGACRRLPISH